MKSKQIFFFANFLSSIIVSFYRAGKIIDLKSDDTDVETNRKHFPKQRKMIRRRRRPRHSEKEGQNGGDDEAKGVSCFFFILLKTILLNHFLIIRKILNQRTLIHAGNQKEDLDVEIGLVFFFVLSKFFF